MSKNDSIVLNKHMCKSHAQSLNKKNQILSAELDHSNKHNAVYVSKSIDAIYDDYTYPKEYMAFEWEHLFLEKLNKHGQEDVAHIALKGL